MRWILTCVAAGFLLAVTPASAQDQDYEATRHAAERGDADAQLNLGFRYDTGRGVPQDDAEAVRWYRLAAKQGNALAPAQSRGSCTAKVRAYRRTTLKRSGGTAWPPSRATPNAQYNLGSMYGTGEGVPQDDAEAVRWYRLAAKQGNASAQNNLGSMYGTGRGVPQDDAEAVRWYRLAAKQGNASAQLNLGLRYGTGQGVPQDDAEAVRWYRLAAEQGNANAQLNLGFRYDTGRGVPQDDAEAVRWYRLAAKQGNARAQYNLGVTYGHRSWRTAGRR